MNQLILTLSTLASFLLGFSLIAAIHELGHLLIAKWCGIRVNRYMVFFPPTLLKWRWRDTEYGLGSIPLGGFVEIEGMGGDINDLDKSTIPSWDFRQKPAWQRSLVMIGGILFNLISAYLIIVCLLIATGKPYLSKEALNQHGIAPTTIGTKVGFQKSDRIIQVNGHTYQDTAQLREPLLQDNPVTYTVRRDEQKINIIVTHDIQQQLKNEQKELWEPLIPYQIEAVTQHSIADKAGLTAGDTIISLNGVPTPYLQDLHKILYEHKGGILTIVYQRNDKEYTVAIELPKGTKLGIALAQTLPLTYHHYTLPEAFSQGSKRLMHIIRAQIQGISKIIRREVSLSESIQSPVAIASLFSQYQGFTGFFYLIAFLSIILAIMNLLPLPALDGFHLLINLCEATTGKKIPRRWYLKIQSAGAIFLLGLTLLLIFKDLYKLLFT